MTAKERSTAVLLIIAVGIIVALAWGLLPVRAAGRLKCEGPLRGADPLERATEGYLVHREDAACRDKANSRLAMIGFVSVVFVALGVSAVLLPESNFERVAFGGEDPEDVYERN